MAPTDSSRDVSRISADSPQDWERVKDNVKQAMRAILARKLADDPSIAHTQDPVSVHLDNWLSRVFEGAKPNLRVNGQNFEDYEAQPEETEPFDETLDRRIWTLNAERIEWDKTLADHRRQTPLMVENFMSELLSHQRTAQYIEPEDEDILMDEGLPTLERRNEIATTHYATLELVEDLNKVVPSLIEKSDRAKEVAAEISNLSL